MTTIQRLKVEGGDDLSSTASITNAIRIEKKTGELIMLQRWEISITNNDESDRLDLQHHLYTLTFDGKLFTCTAGTENQVYRVLDVGTGTGIWAIDFAHENLEALKMIGQNRWPQ